MLRAEELQLQEDDLLLDRWWHHNQRVDSPAHRSDLGLLRSEPLLIPAPQVLLVPRAEYRDGDEQVPAQLGEV
jgi:hypothetical protein